MLRKRRGASVIARGGVSTTYRAARLKRQLSIRRFNLFNNLDRSRTRYSPALQGLNAELAPSRAVEIATPSTPFSSCPSRQSSTPKVFILSRRKILLIIQ